MSYGQGLNFNMYPSTPYVTTLPATNINRNSIIMEGLVNSLGKFMEAGFEFWGYEYGENLIEYGEYPSYMSDGTGYGGFTTMPFSVMATVEGGGGDYYYRSVARNLDTGVKIYGDLYFLSTSGRPTVYEPVASASPTGVAVNVLVNPRGEATEVYLRYGIRVGEEVGPLITTASTNIGNGIAQVPTSITVTGLPPATT